MVANRELAFVLATVVMTARAALSDCFTIFGESVTTTVDIDDVDYLGYFQVREDLSGWVTGFVPGAPATNVALATKFSINNNHLIAHVEDERVATTEYSGSILGNVWFDTPQSMTDANRLPLICEVHKPNPAAEIICNPQNNASLQTFWYCNQTVLIAPTGSANPEGCSHFVLLAYAAEGCPVFPTGTSGTISSNPTTSSSLEEISTSAVTSKHHPNTRPAEEYSTTLVDKCRHIPNVI